MIDLKFWRKKRNLTRAQLAAMVSTSQNYIYEIETRKKNPSIAMIYKLAKALDIRIIVRDANDCNCPYAKYKKGFRRSSSCKRILKKF